MTRSSSSGPAALGLPPAMGACLFDLDGVLTETATIHAAAWKEMFDEFLRAHAERTGAAFVPFDAAADYDEYVDGKPQGRRHSIVPAVPRHRPARGRARTIRPDAETIAGLGQRKNDIVLRRIRARRRRALSRVGALRRRGAGRGPAPGGRLLQRQLRRGARRGRDRSICSRRASTGRVVADAPGAASPRPTRSSPARRALGVDPRQAAVFEDALAGVEAGRAGGFGYVVGVDRVGQARRAARARRRPSSSRDLAELLGRPGDPRTRPYRGRAVVLCARPRSTWTCWPRASRCSRCPTATSAARQPRRG